MKKEGSENILCYTEANNPITYYHLLKVGVSLLWEFIFWNSVCTTGQSLIQRKKWQNKITVWCSLIPYTHHSDRETWLDKGQMSEIRIFWQDMILGNQWLNKLWGGSIKKQVALNHIGEIKVQEPDNTEPWFAGHPIKGNNKMNGRWVTAHALWDWPRSENYIKLINSQPRMTDKRKETCKPFSFFNLEPEKSNKEIDKEKRRTWPDPSLYPPPSPTPE